MTTYITDWTSKSYTQLESAVFKKVDRRLLPILCGLVVSSSICGSNLGVARIMGLAEELQIYGSNYSVAALVFFIPTVVLAAPANSVMQASRPSLFLGSCLLLLGITNVGQGKVNSYSALVACRVLMGMWETGFQAGSIYLVASYYPREALHRRVALLFTFRILSGAFNNLLGYALAHMSGIAGLSAWRWILIIEGMLAGASSAIAFVVIPRWPKNAKFLRAHEQALLLTTLRRGRVYHDEPETVWKTLGEIVQDPKVYFCASIHFCCTNISSSTTYFLPTILRDLGWTSEKAAYMAIPIYSVAALLCLVSGFASDLAGRRFPFCAGSLVLTVLGFGILLANEHVSKDAQYAACFLVISGNSAALSISVTWLSNNIFSAKKRGLALGLAAGIGNCGNFLGANIYVRNQEPRYRTGNGVNLALAVLAMVSATILEVVLIVANKLNFRDSGEYIL